jgi:hypothetical protein
MNDLYALAAGVLFQHGFAWHVGRPLAARAAAGFVCPALAIVGENVVRGGAVGGPAGGG